MTSASLSPLTDRALANTCSDHPLVIEGLGEYRVKSAHQSANVAPFLPLMLMARSSRSDAEIDLGVLVGQSFDEELRAWQLFPMVCLLRRDLRVA